MNFTCTRRKRSLEAPAPAAKPKPVQVADDVPDARMVCPDCGILWEIYGPVEIEVCPTCSSDLFAAGETRTVRVVVQ